MALTRRAKPADADRFMASAPDAGPARWQGDQQDTDHLAIAPALMDKLDNTAEHRHVGQPARLTMRLVDRLAQEPA